MGDSEVLECQIENRGLSVARSLLIDMSYQLLCTLTKTEEEIWRVLSRLASSFANPLSNFIDIARNLLPQQQ